MQYLLKKTVMFVLPALLILNTSAMAQVVLNVDKNIKVTAINGTAVNSSMFRSPTMQYTMTAGKQVITARYDRLYRLRGDNHDYLKSANITLVTDLVDGKNYQLVMLDQPERYQEAKEYVTSPVLAVQEGNKVIARQELVAGTEDTIGLKTIGSIFGFNKNQATLDNTKVIAAVNNTASTAVQPSISSTAVSTTDTLDTFMQLWLQATPDEREKMRAWIEK